MGRSTAKRPSRAEVAAPGCAAEASDPPLVRRRRRRRGPRHTSGRLDQDAVHARFSRRARPRCVHELPLQRREDVEHEAVALPQGARATRSDAMPRPRPEAVTIWTGSTASAEGATWVQSCCTMYPCCAMYRAQLLHLLVGRAVQGCDLGPQVVHVLARDHSASGPPRGPHDGQDDGGGCDLAGPISMRSSMA